MLSDQGLFDEAIRHLLTAVELSPGHAAESFHQIPADLAVHAISAKREAHLQRFQIAADRAGSAPVVLRAGAVAPIFRVEHALQQVGRQQSALGADRLEVVRAS